MVKRTTTINLGADSLDTESTDASSTSVAQSPRAPETPGASDRLAVPEGKRPNSSVVLLGMHRSGTSAIAHTLTKLGFSLPWEAVPPDANNPNGYWEPRPVVEIHDRFLHSVRRIWSDPGPMPPEVFHTEAAAKARSQLSALADRSDAMGDAWLIKDPRMCRLLPLWNDILGAPPRDWFFLFVLRSPLAVAGSLEKRDGFPTEKSLLLWLRHYLEAELATRGANRLWLRFEDLNAGAGCNTLQRLLRLTTDPDFPENTVQSAIHDTLVPALIHHDFDRHADGLQRYPWVQSAYRGLCMLADGKDEDSAQALLDDARSALDDADNLLLFDSWGASPPREAERYLWLLQEIEHYRREIAAQRSEIDGLRKSFEGARADTTQLERRCLELTRALDRSLDSSHQTKTVERQYLNLLNKSLDVIRQLERRAQSPVGSDVQATHDGLESQAAHGQSLSPSSDWPDRHTGPLLRDAIRQRDALLQSKCWRYTAPIRWMLKPFQR